MKNENILWAILGGLVLLKLNRGASVGAIVDDQPPGVTPCRDGKFSTYGPRAAGGVCSYHGGRAIARAKKEKVLPECSLSFDEFRAQRAQRLATEAKEATKQALKSSPGSYTSTWYKAELKRAFNFNYDYYRYSEDKKYALKEYEEFCKNEGSKPRIGYFW